MNILTNCNFLAILGSENEKMKKRKAARLSVLEWKVLLLGIKEFQNKNYHKLGLTRKLSANDVIELTAKINNLTEEERYSNITKDYRKKYLSGIHIANLKKAIKRIQRCSLPRLNSKEEHDYASIVVDTDIKNLGFNFGNRFIQNLYINKDEIERKSRIFSGYSLVDDSIFLLKKGNSIPMFILLSKHGKLCLKLTEINKILGANYKRNRVKELFNVIGKDIEDTGVFKLNYKSGIRKHNKILDKNESYYEIELELKKLPKKLQKSNIKAMNNEFIAKKDRKINLLKLLKEFDEDDLVEALDKISLKLKSDPKNFDGLLRKVCETENEEIEMTSILSTLKEIPNF